MTLPDGDAMSSSVIIVIEQQQKQRCDQRSRRDTVPVNACDTSPFLVRDS
jgi:hypothetical protein